jgi:hypothetical protein
MKKKKEQKKITPVRKVELTEWLEEGESLFGKDKTKWRFKCPSCGNSQTFDEFVPLMDKEKIESVLYFSCIGRWDKTQGCDYTLGGLFVIANVYVIKDGKEFPVMEFAKEENKVPPTKFM